MQRRRPDLPRPASVPRSRRRFGILAESSVRPPLTVRRCLTADVLLLAQFVVVKSLQAQLRRRASSRLRRQPLSPWAAMGDLESSPASARAGHLRQSCSFRLCKSWRPLWAGWLRARPCRLLRRRWPSPPSRCVRSCSCWLLQRLRRPPPRPCSSWLRLHRPLPGRLLWLRRPRQPLPWLWPRARRLLRLHRARLQLKCHLRRGPWIRVFRCPALKCRVLTPPCTQSFRPPWPRRQSPWPRCPPPPLWPQLLSPLVGRTLLFVGGCW